jgi:hypothetical protein
MAVALADIVDRLQTSIPQVDGSPADSQYQACVIDAVADFSAQLGPIREAPLSVVSGTATYTLPADFLKLVSLSASLLDGTLVQPAGLLVPMGSLGRNERYAISGREITIYPTPNYSASRTLVYQSAFVLSATDVYQGLADADVSIILLKASALLLLQLGASAAPSAFRYQIGDITVDKSSATKNLSDAAGQLEASYAKAVERRRGPMTTRARFSAADHAAWAGREIP